MKTFFFIIIFVNLSFCQFLNNESMDSLLVTIPLDCATAKTLDDFKSISIDGGKAFQCQDDACKDTLQKFSLPAGILFSDKKAVTYTYYEKMLNDANRRFVIAKDLYHQQTDIVNKTVSEYDNRIIKLEKDAKRSWIEKNNIYIGFIIGIATSILIESITVKVVR